MPTSELLRNHCRKPVRFRAVFFYVERPASIRVARFGRFCRCPSGRVATTGTGQVEGDGINSGAVAVNMLVSLWV